MNRLAQIDMRSFLWFNRLQQYPHWMTVTRLVSKSGDGYLYVAIAILIYLSPALHGQEFVQVGLLAFFIEIPAFILLKHLFKRNRPFEQLGYHYQAIAPSDKFSLPSGHSTAAFLMASLISIYFPAFSMLALCWAAFIGLSRVVLGVHYPGDIVAGAALGVGCTLLSSTFAIALLTTVATYL